MILFKNAKKANAQANVYALLKQLHEQLQEMSDAIEANQVKKSA